MKTKIVILSVLVLMVGVLIGCTPAPTPCCQCNGGNLYMAEHNECILFYGNYGPDFDSALDSLLRSYQFDLSQYSNHYFILDTLYVLNHPDRQNRTFFITQFYVNGDDNVIAGKKYNQSDYWGFELGGSIVLYWIIDTKGDVYDFDEVPDD